MSLTDPRVAEDEAAAKPTYPPLALFIDGDWTVGSGGASEEVLNPATGSPLGRVPHASVADLDRALAAAERGFSVWRKTPVDARAGILAETASLIRDRAASIASTMTMEGGKLAAEARAEVMRAARLLEWNAEEARRCYGRIIPTDDDHLVTVRHEPIGPIAAFTAWNFPAGGPMRKLAAALAAGCSVVIKASEEVPGTACELVRCFDQAGLPPGVLNLVFGVPAAVSEHLILSPITRAVAFTGSVPVGKRLAAMAGSVMKPALMELGGHAPVVVCPDADLPSAVRLSAAAKFVNAGQVCTSPSRFIVHESLFDDYVAEFVRYAESLTVGDGSEPGVSMGPLANDRRLRAMEHMVADAVGRGATVLTGGKAVDRPGWFFEPTVLIDVPTSAEVMVTEPFGPLAPIVRYRDLDDALALANALPYGLAAYGFTNSATVADELGRRLEAGILSINHCGGSIREAPSGGLKDSGYGKEGGAEALDGYLATKRISHRLRSK